MATPIIEMGLGGSLRAVASTHTEAYAICSMRTRRFFVDFGQYWADSFWFTGEDNSARDSFIWGGAGGIDAENHTATYVTGGVAGDAVIATGVLPGGGYGATFNGVDRSMGMGVLVALGIAPITIEVVLTFLAVPGTGEEPIIFGHSEFGLFYDDAGSVHVYYDGASVLSAAVSTGVVTHLVATRAGTSPDTITLYVNGASSSATPSRVSLASEGFVVANLFPSTDYLNASVYWLAVYDGVLSSGQVAQNYAATSWTNVSADSLGTQPLVIERGIRDDKPSTRVATTGTLTFALNNLGSNSGGLTGYYSPGHANCRDGFGKGTPVRVRVSSDVLFVGRIRVIAPDPGLTSGVTRVMATDYLDTAATFLLENAAIRESVPGSEVFLGIVGLVPNQPSGLEVSTGTDVYALALDNTRDESVPLLTEFVRLALSELGYIYQRRTGALVYEARGTRILQQQAAQVTLADTMIGLDVAEVSSASINRVQITVHPRVVDDDPTTVLFALTTPLSIASGEVKTIFGPYRTPNVPGITTRVGGLDMVTPVETTDYLLNSAADGSGVNLTSLVTLDTSFGANGVQFVVSWESQLDDSAGSIRTAYLTRLQCRGRGVYDFRTVVIRAQNDAAMAADGVNALTLDMVYQEDPNVGQALADLLLNGYGDLSGTRVQRVTCYPTAPGLPANLLLRDISDRVAVSESITGATGEYYINGVKQEYQNGTLPKLTWWVTPATPQSYWVLGTVDASELNETTRLAAA